MEQIPQKYIPESTYLPPSAKLFGSKKLGEGFPNAYWADSMEDLKEGRSQQLKLLIGKVRFPPSPSRDHHPFGIFSNKLTAIIILPKVNHFPVHDPQEERWLWGLLKSKSEAVKLRDGTGELVTYPYKGHMRFSRHFPYVTCFDEIRFGKPTFSQDNWNYYRELSWERSVVIMAQFAETFHRDIIDEYWLLHIQGEPRDGMRRYVGEKVKEIKVPPLYSPRPVLG